MHIRSYQGVLGGEVGRGGGGGGLVGGRGVGGLMYNHFRCYIYYAVRQVQSRMSQIVSHYWTTDISVYIIRLYTRMA